MSDRSTASWQSRAVHGLALAAIVAYFAWHVVGHAVPVGLAGPQCDNLTQGLPKLTFFIDELRAGRFPTWDPWAGLGAADYPVRSYLVYPTTLLTALVLPPWLAMLADYLLNFVLMYAFAAWLLRRAGGSTLAVAAGALAVTFGGLNLRYIFYPYFSQTAAWIPLVFLALHGLFDARQRPARHVALGAAALGLMVLAGMQNYVVYTLAFGAAYVLFQTWTTRHASPDKVRVWQRVWPLALALVALGFVIGAARVLPLLDQADKLRGGYATWEAFRTVLLFPGVWATALAPGLFADYGVRFNSTTLAYGLVTWSLAAAFAVAGRKTKTDWFVLAVVVVALLVSLRGPVSFVLFKILPGYGSFQPTRVWSVAGLALAWLAVRALAQWADDTSRRLLPLVAWATAGVFLLVFALTAMGLPRAGLRHLLPLAVGAGGLAAAWPARRLWGRRRAAHVLALALALEVLLRAGVSSERIDLRVAYAPTPITTALREAGPHPRLVRVGDRWSWIRDGRLYTQEALKIDGVEDLHAYSSMIDPALRAVVDSHRRRTDFGLTPFDEGAAIQPFLDPLRALFLAEKIRAPYLLSQIEIKVYPPLVELARHGGLFLYYIPEQLPRVRFASRTTVIHDRATAVDKMRRIDNGVILSGDGAPELSDNFQDVSAQVEELAWTPTRETYHVAAAGPGFLVIPELFDDNWWARVNDKPTPVYRADAVFRAVQVPAGESTVEFGYRPRALHWGAAASLIGLVIVAVLLLIGRRRRPLPTGAPHGAAARSPR